MKFINGLHFNNFRGDIYGGITAAVVALPLALAMGVSSGAGPVAGLYGAILVGCHKQVCDMMKKQGVTAEIPEENRIKERLDALRFSRRFIQQGSAGASGLL